jgi:hypothetical protein
VELSARAMDLDDLGEESDGSQLSRTTRARSHKGSLATSGSAAKKSKKKHGSPSPKGKKKKVVKKISKEKQCFVCPLPKYKKSRFCRKHENDKNSLCHQAVRDGKKELFEKLMNDPMKAEAALDKFDRENPPGRFRKGLIQWADYERFFTKEFVTKDRRAEEEWSWKDFRLDRKKSGFDDEECKAEWRELLASDYDREGESFDAKIWLPSRRQRIRDENTRVGNTVSEKSKPLKGLKAKDCEPFRSPLPSTRASAESSCVISRPKHTSVIFPGGPGNARLPTCSC